MRINTIQIQGYDRNRKFNNKYNNTQQITPNNEVAFTGLYSMLSGGISSKRYSAAIDIANRLGLANTKVVKLLTGVSSNRVGFMERLSDYYNAYNFPRSKETKESGNIVLEIFKSVNRPRQEHFDILEKWFNSPVAECKELFDLAKTKSRLRYILSFRSEIIGNSIDFHRGIIKDVLSSPYSQEYVKHFSKYKDYFILNKNNEDAVKILDEMVRTETFSAGKYTRMIKDMDTKDSFGTLIKGTDILNQDVYLQIANSYNKRLLTHFKAKNSLHVDTLQQGGDKPLLEILQSTNKNNYAIRKAVIRNFVMIDEKLDNCVNYLQEMAKLLKTLDESKHAKSFVSKLIKKDVYIPDIGNLNQALDTLPHKDLDVFFKYYSTMFKGVKTLSKEDVAAYSKNNPFNSLSSFIRIYEKAEKDKYGRVTLGDRISLIIEYFKTKFKYAYGDFGVKGAKSAKVETRDVKISTSQGLDVVESPKIVQEPTAPIFKLPKLEELLNPTVSMLGTKIQPVYTQPVRKPIFEFKNQLLLPFIPPQKPVSKAKLLRAQVKEQVVDYVTRKLGKKTLERQKDKYDNFATKMRLVMLPEIFSSIADTRKADRLLGKKKSSSSSNKDALKLFTMINGKNKKLVNYLLKKRKADETRMFDVKEIIEILKRAEVKIKDEKYSPKEAKGYYNNIFDLSVQNFGKVKIKRRTKTAVNDIITRS